MPRIACENCLYEFNVSKQVTGGVRCPECGGTVPVGGPARKKSKSSGSIPTKRKSSATIPTRQKSSASIPTNSSGQLPPRVLGESAADDESYKATIKTGAIAGGGVALVIAIFMFATGGDDPVVAPPAGNVAGAAGGRAAPAAGGNLAPLHPDGATGTADDQVAASDDNARDDETGNDASPGDSPVASSGEGGAIEGGDLEMTSSAGGGPEPRLDTPEAQSQMASRGAAGGEPPVDRAQLAPIRTEKLQPVELVAMIEPSVVRLNVTCGARSTHGSGFVADEAGTVVTNFHVIAGADRVEAIFADARTIRVAGVRAVDPARDIAILQLDLDGDSVAPIPISDGLPRKGASVYGFGSPQGLDFTTSAGIVSAIRESDQMREVSESIGQLQGTWLQTSTPISGGSSGGPLVDQYGNVVGVNAMTMISGQNLNFAISCVELRRVYTDASPEVTPFHAAQLAPPAERSTREFARTEIDTARGYALFAQLDDVVVVPSPEIEKIDSSGRLWNFTRANLEIYAKRMDIDLSFDEPEPESTVLMIFMTFEEEGGGNVPTQDVDISADLVCYDRSAPDSRHYVRVWHNDAGVGNVSMELLARGGRLSNRANGNLRGFFSDFRSAHIAAMNFQERQAEHE